MSSTLGENNISMSKCATCGSAGDKLKKCGGCNQVKYCNRNCQRSHWSKHHKKECRQLAASSGNNTGSKSEGIGSIELSDEELTTLCSIVEQMVALYEKQENMLAAEFLRIATSGDKDKPDDELLFQDPPPKEDCPLCFLPMPRASGIGIGGVGAVFQSCCGKTVCSGCMSAVHDMNIGKSCCPFCRKDTATSDEEHIKRTKLRMKAGDAEAFNMLAHQYSKGSMGLPKDSQKAYELWSQAINLGSINAQYNISVSYVSKDDELSSVATYLNIDEEQAIQNSIHHTELAAIGGHEIARNNLGALEASLGNMNRAMKHWMISARAGFDISLKQIGNGYKAGLVTKDEYASTLRAYQFSLDEMKSEQRSKVVKPKNSIWKESLSNAEKCQF